MQHIAPYLLLESLTGHCLFAIEVQDLTRKSITVEYSYSVKIHSWDIRILCNEQYDHDLLTYIWEASDDNENWKQKSRSKFAKVRLEVWNGCDRILSFTRTQSNERHKYWRVQIQHGKVKKAPYFDIMLMTVI